MNAGNNSQTSADGPKIVTAAVIVIGDEILSGRTKDKNIGTIADFCAELAITLCEVRVVSDEMDAIVEAVNALRGRNDYVFTTGGIGPTHDDITADAVATAFGVPLRIDDEARQILENRYGTVDVSPERLRMARVPEGGTLIFNSVSGAPGFTVENVHVMAGVPKVMEAMLADLAPRLKGGAKVYSRNMDCGVGESTVSAALGRIQERYPEVKIGSYPQLGRLPVFTQLVLRSSDVDKLETATQEVRAMVDALHREKNIVLSEDGKA